MFLYTLRVNLFKLTFFLNSLTGGWYLNVQLDLYSLKHTLLQFSIHACLVFTRSYTSLSYFTTICIVNEQNNLINSYYETKYFNVWNKFLSLSSINQSHLIVHMIFIHIRQYKFLNKRTRGRNGEWGGRGRNMCECRTLSQL